MKRSLLLSLALVLVLTETATSQDSRQEYRRHWGFDTLSFGQAPGKVLYSAGDSLFFKSGASAAVRVAPYVGLTGSGTTNYLPQFTGSTTLGLSNLRRNSITGDLEFVNSSGGARRWLFLEDSKTDTGFVLLNTTVDLPGYITKGLVLGTNNWRGITVYGPITAASGASLGALSRIRGKLYAADIDSGTIDAARLPPGYGISGTGYSNRLALWSTANTMSYGAIQASGLGIGFPFGYGSTYYMPSDSVNVYAFSSPFSFETGKAALYTSRSIYSTGGVRAKSFQSEFFLELALGSTVPSVSVDWSQYSSGKVTLAGNGTINFTGFNTSVTQTFTVSVSATGSYSINWPVYVKWQGGSAPSQTASKTDVYSFISIGGVVYGSVIHNFDN